MAATKSKAQATAESKAEYEVNEVNEVVQAARAWTETLREAGEAVVDSAIAIQDRNAQFTQFVVDRGLKQIEDQAATLRTLNSTLADQSDARRATFRHLIREASEAYIGFLSLPVKFARGAVESAEETMKQAADSEA